MTDDPRTLTEQVQKLIDDMDAPTARNKALRDAEALAEKYKDIKPTPFAVPMEKFFGLPAFSK